MLSGEIKKYPEVYTPNYSSGVSYTSYKMMNETDKKVYEGRYAKALEDAKEILGVGDKVMLASSATNVKIVTGFIEDVEDSITYMGEICVILARDVLYPAQTSMKFSIKELDCNTIVKCVEDSTPSETAALLSLKVSNDE